MARDFSRAAEKIQKLGKGNRNGKGNGNGNGNGKDLTQSSQRNCRGHGETEEVMEA
ncbi:MAG: hypothetical protein WAN14_04895 [Candidatus Acidiferrales bacterium]